MWLYEEDPIKSAQMNKRCIVRTYENFTEYKKDSWEFGIQTIIFLCLFECMCVCVCYFILLFLSGLKSNPWSGKIPWRKKWQPTAGCLPENTRGQRSLAGYSPCGCKDWATQQGCFQPCFPGTSVLRGVSLSCLSELSGRLTYDALYLAHKKL